VPDQTAELSRLGARWLGYDIETGTTFTAPIISGLSEGIWRELIAAPSRYGLHATLKAPFRLSVERTEAELVEAVRDFARQTNPVRLPVMSLTYYRGFFGLLPAIRNEQVSDLAWRVVRAFEPFRAALTPEEIAGRNPDALTERQRDNLERWGYPYVLDETEFHITLTSQVATDEAPAVEAILTGVFEPVLGRPLLVDRIALAVEREPGARFEILAAATFGHPLAYNRRAIQLDMA
jgi:hypothetical protein